MAATQNSNWNGDGHTHKGTHTLIQRGPHELNDLQTLEFVSFFGFLCFVICEKCCQSARISCHKNKNAVTIVCALGKNYFQSTFILQFAA